MAKPKDTKAIAGRIDITYHARPSWFRWWRRWVIVSTTLACMLVVGYITFGYLHRGRFQRMLNPAPVTLVHAHFENQCAACHGTDGKGGFFKVVFDNACLNCHDGASHHPKADLNPGTSGAVHLISLSNPKKSADCMVCHTEHRGKEALRGDKDQLCLQCHENLAAHGGGGSKTTNQITAFDMKSGHPEFGREIPTTQPGGAWADTTWGKGHAFKFNHNTHLTSKDPNRGLPIQSCATCHQTQESSGLPVDRLGYMRPVKYEDHCRKCHDIAIPGTDGEPSEPGLRLVHDRLDVVRTQLANMWDLYMQSPSAAKLSGDKAKAQWVDEEMKKLDPVLNTVAKVADKYTDQAAKIREGFKDTDSKMAEDMLPDDADLWEKKLTTAAKAEWIVATVPGLRASCDKCHKLEGLPSVLYKETLNLSMQAKAPPAFPVLLRTVPTGIPTTPRRWFAHAEFPHGAHRDVQCMSCHTNMDQDKDDGIARLPTLASCVECHHTPTPQSRGAGASCVACHHFHDRTLERAPDGRLNVLHDVAPISRK